MTATAPKSNLVDEITILQTLPKVFAGMEGDEAIAGSEVWLRNLTFRRGEKILIRAESGKGKSSLISFIYGRRTDYQGSILFDGKEISGFKPRYWCELRRISLGWLPQEMALFSELTALDNVKLKNNLTGFRSEQWIRDAFSRLEIDNRIDKPAGLLSVGQQQRVAIIRSLCQPLDFLFLDEPVSHLDERTNSLAAALIQETLQTTGAAVLTTSVGNNLSISYDREIIL